MFSLWVLPKGFSHSLVLIRKLTAVVAILNHILSYNRLGFGTYTELGIRGWNRGFIIGIVHLTQATRNAADVLEYSQIDTQHWKVQNRQGCTLIN